MYLRKIICENNNILCTSVSPPLPQFRNHVINFFAWHGEAVDGCDEFLASSSFSSAVTTD